MKSKPYFSKIITVGVLLFFLYSPFVASSVYNDDDSTKISGVSISPSKINFFLKPGEIKNREVTITNYTSKSQKFKISTRDFGINHNGSNNILGEGKNNKYSLKQWINISPNFVTLAPNEEKKVMVRINIPNSEENNHAAWSMLLIEQINERKSFKPDDKSGKAMGFGVIPTFAFGVWIYQNPPYLDKTKVDIISFEKGVLKDNNVLKSELENTSENIAFCKAYIEITNLKTGATTTLSDKKFTLLPSHKREIYFTLTTPLPAGNYSSIIVVDFGNENEIAIGEMDFNM